MLAMVTVPVPDSRVPGPFPAGGLAGQPRHVVRRSRS
jgi:hypothetical protein